MTGMLHIKCKQMGKLHCKIIMIALVAVCVFSGCSARWWLGDGRDWEKEMANGYAITHVNGNCIRLTYKEAPESPGASVVINNLFVAAYFASESYIALEGIPLADVFATDEELVSSNFVYYLVNAETHEIFGPFETEEEFKECCKTLRIQPQQWIETSTKVERSLADWR